jgi:hypothetical protein
MTAVFRIDSVHLETTNGTVAYKFSSDLTVLSGHTGVGKTTLFELIKYGLGGDGLLAPVARESITDVHISIHIGDLRLRLSRGLAAEVQRTIRVTDLVTDERLRDHTVGGDERPISDLLMTAMGLETGLLAAARGGRSTSAGAKITFNDIFHFMYIPQAEMNRDIAWSQQGYYEPKRKSVFEILFGITSSAILRMRSEVNTLKSDIDNAAQSANIVRQFLADTGLTSRFEAEVKLADVQQQEARARASLNTLKHELSDVVDRQSQVLRDLLNDAEDSLAEARHRATELNREREEYVVERLRVQGDLDRLARMETAGLRLASIEFSVCPRCTQRLDQRIVTVGHCPVCLQEDIVLGLPTSAQYESTQLQNQLGEIDDQLQIISEQVLETARVANDRDALVNSLTAEIDSRTASRITPRLQAYADASAGAERSAVEQEALEQVLRQWDRAEELQVEADEKTKRRTQMQADLQRAERELTRRKSELFAELDAEFQSTVTDFGIPGVERASISPDTYLPLLNGQPFIEVSSAGGIITATQVAYWLSLLTVATRRRDTRFPGFLLLDSPRLALNAEQDIASHMYRRFATQVAVVPRRLQIIVGDNDLPIGIDRNFEELTFSYDSPTISTVVHPGPAQVHTLNDPTITSEPN